ncbi:MAG: response regulator [Cyanobacteriota bacterium]|nr:response regulator [Cyanobacteriota bacterium]
MGKPVILCVDDEITILQSLKRQLYQAFENNYLYEMAESADEALEVIEDLLEEETDIIVIVSDWLMPGMKGDEFLIEVHKNFPKIVKILLTGQAEQEAIEQVKIKANLHQYLSKPWDDRELIDCIKSGIAKL